MTMALQQTDPALERARARAKELREFYTHLATYLVVCTGLVILDLVNNEAGDTTSFLGLDWAYWPMFGWGIFLALHGARTFIGKGQWEERKTQELYEKEKQHSR